jgi:hypothetical protein
VTFTTLLTVRRRLNSQDGELRRLMSLVARHDEPPATAAAPDQIEGMAMALDQLAARLDALGMQQATVARRGNIDEAAAMARAGGEATDIAARAGISVGEAELLLRVHAAQDNNH